MNDRWTATWGTAQQLAPAVALGGGPQMPGDDTDVPPPAAPTTVGAQTVRMVARVTVGGSAVRVALANSFGHAPVRVGAAALDGTRLTFGGGDTVVLPTGALIHSDPVDIEVAPQTDVVVSLYLPDEGVTPTVHEVGLRTAWLAPGDQTAERDLRDATEFHSYLWLTGIDVLAPRESAAVIALGDSLVDGMETTPGADAPWPSVLARRLAAHPGLPPRAVINMGIAGNRVLRETDGMGASALARFDRDVLARPGARWLIVLAGANDMFFGLMPGMPETERATVADIVTGYRMLIARAHLHGLRVIGCTLPPLGGAPVFTPEFADMHKQVNGWIRDSGEFDAVTDLETALRDPADPAGMPAELLAADGVHPNDAGHAAIAGAFDPELFRTIGQ
jgi:lysophospholipase L1-like esterase